MGGRSVPVLALVAFAVLVPGALLVVAVYADSATLPIGGAVLALGALTVLRRPGARRVLLGSVAACVAIACGLGIAALMGLVPAVPDPRSPAAWAVLATGLALYGGLFRRALGFHRLTRRGADLFVALGVACLAAALPFVLLLDDRSLGSLLGYAFEFVGISVIGFIVARDLLRGAARASLVLGDAAGADLVVDAEAFVGPHVRALLAELAEKQAYTEDHTRRVALRAAQVGDELGLSPGRLRDLAIGGLLHDVGKLAVPAEILGKPGPLTDDEYQAVMQHVYTGPALLRKLGGFSPMVHRLVRGHHERFDGSGYPKAVAGDPIPLDVAILAVCDVYDALVSERVYRKAWSRERALEHLRAGAGRLFDATCVEALADVLARERRADLAVAV
jgi:HD-GYP domain-containing protein (c-di-GMP phosphodiesterase class II)